MNNEKVKSNVPKLLVRAMGGKNSVMTTSDWICPTHYHDELEFLSVYTGEFVIYFEGEELVAKAGDVIFVNAGVPHRTRLNSPSATGLVQFREGDFISGELARIIRYSRKMYGMNTKQQVMIIHSEELFSALNEIVEEGQSAEAACDLFVKGAVFKVLGLLYRMGILEDADKMLREHDLQKILPVLSHINDNYSSDVKISELAAMLSFDESYFCRIFKSATGATFTEYLNFVRICKAEKLLTKTRDSILEISEAVGFSSSSYFTRIFKRYRHTSPGAYRKLLYKNI